MDICLRVNVGCVDQYKDDIKMELKKDPLSFQIFKILAIQTEKEKGINKIIITYIPVYAVHFQSMYYINFYEVYNVFGTLLFIFKKECICIYLSPWLVVWFTL